MIKKNELVPLFFIFSGIFIFSWIVFLPILEAKSSLNNTGEVVSPYLNEANNTLKNYFNLPVFPFSKLLNETRDSSDFYLTIKKLGIEKSRIIANLDTGNPDIYLKELLQGIGHLKGTGFPGDRGTVFLFGHSSLPFLFNKSNYATIFSTLDKLKKGDLISVEFAGRVFNYKVDSLKVIGAKSNIQELLSSKESLVLLTCFPPGLLSERLVVTALPTN